MKGTYYSVGAGPGDPELLTIKAIKTIQKSDIIAVPKSGAKDNAVMLITEEYIKGKEILYCDMPMTKDKAKVDKAHEESTVAIAKLLDEGKDVAFITLGDPSIYSTAMYIHQRLEKRGYDTVMIAGVPSFCAVAAKLNTTLCEKSDMLHIIPATYEDNKGALMQKGNKVIMKSGKSINEVKTLISGETWAKAVECCGMPNEKIHNSLDTIEADASYFCVVVVKEENND